ncbi:MAG: T9SS type A sorting domain-containing protein [Candidatus Cloacimonetes bacterium]|nr:T9SS type A sorting domain-containing protein [Candidatus Cloacimonadota bacterium]
MRTCLLAFAMLGAILSLQAQSPDWSFGVNPLPVMESWYDFMPGGYNQLPVQIQAASVAGDNGVYIVCHAQLTVTSVRNIYLAYVWPNGDVEVFFAGMEDTRGGYPAMDIDPVTQDPLFVWHSDIDNDNDLETLAQYDRWHEYNQPGELSCAREILPPDGSETNGHWPGFFTGHAPSYNTDGKRRAYVFNRDYEGTGWPLNTMLYLGFADYDTADLEFCLIDDLDWLDWSYQPISQFEEWAADSLVVKVDFCEALARDSVLAISGYLHTIDDSLEDIDIPDLFVLWNDNYGEGEWELFITNSEQWFGNPDDHFFMAPYNSNHMSSSFDTESRLHMPLNFGFHVWSEGNIMLYSWFSYMRDVVFNHSDGTFAINNLWPQTEDGSPYMPGDEWGNPGIHYWPIYWYEWDESFHENSFKIASDPERSLLCAVWSDGTKARKWHHDDDPDYAEWENTPEIAVSVSSDNGDTWSEPILLNANETPELAGMIPCYVYPGDRIEYLGDGIGRVHLFFLDDHSYGSFARNGNGANMGGTLRYMALDIDFGNVSAGAELLPPPALSLGNHPNPFNPETTLAFSLPSAGKVELTIYNIRGERVRSILGGYRPAGRHSVTWGGDDDDGRPVASGVYFARLTSVGRTITRKLLLLK